MKLYVAQSNSCNFLIITDEENKRSRIFGNDFSQEQIDFAVDIFTKGDFPMSLCLGFWETGNHAFDGLFDIHYLAYCDEMKRR